jgi:hypothetical protein
MSVGGSGAPSCDLEIIQTDLADLSKSVARNDFVVLDRLRRSFGVKCPKTCKDEHVQGKRLNSAHLEQDVQRHRYEHTQALPSAWLARNREFLGGLAGCLCLFCRRCNATCAFATSLSYEFTLISINSENMSADPTTLSGLDLFLV